MDTKEHSKPELDPNIDLVNSYQAGSSEAGEQLLENFKLFIAKYINICKGSTANTHDVDTALFLALFLKTNEAGIVRRFKFSNKIGASLCNKGLNIINHACESIPFEDMYNIFVMCFLDLAARYRQQKKYVSFSGYIYACYKYAVAREIRSYTKDPIVFSSEFNKYYTDDGEVPKELAEEINYEETDSLWISGHACSERFSELTPLERSIIYKSYVENKSDRVISEEIGFCRKIVMSYRNKAEDKIAISEEEKQMLENRRNRKRRNNK